MALGLVLQHPLDTARAFLATVGARRIYFMIALALVLCIDILGMYNIIIQ